MRPCEVAEKVRKYFGRRFRRGLAESDAGEDELAETLIELEELIIEEASVGKWQLPRFEEMLEKVTEVPTSSPSRIAGSNCGAQV
jgi:hypothetical protein